MSNSKSDTELVDEPLDIRHKLVERINKKDLVPMYDTNHEHSYQVDPADATDTYQAEMCVVTGCNLGRLVAKH